MENHIETKQFSGDAWFRQQVHTRVKQALAKQEETFAREHGNDTDEQLLNILRCFAEKLGHVPQSGEMIGGKYITCRFGTWEHAVDAAELPRPGSMPKLQRRLIYRNEYKKQAALFQQERRATADEKRLASKERAAAAKEEKQLREERDLAWGREHEGDTDEQLLDYLRQCAEELGHSPVTREVLGGSYIAKRFVTWPVALTCAGLELPGGMKAPKQRELSEYRRRQREAEEMNKTQV